MQNKISKNCKVMNCSKGLNHNGSFKEETEDQVGGELTKNDRKLLKLYGILRVAQSALMQLTCKNQKNAYSCPKPSCHFKVIDTTIFAEHMFQIHNERPTIPLFQCIFCNQTFNHKLTLKCHINTHFEKKSRRITSKKCSYNCPHARFLKLCKPKLTYVGSDTKLVQLRGIISDILIIVPKFELSITPTIACRCSRKVELTQNLNTFNGNNIFHSPMGSENLRKKLKCSRCKFTCGNQNALDLHMKYHLTEEPFKCKLCKTYCTTSKQSLRFHLEYVHKVTFRIRKIGMEEDEKVKLISCAQCSYTCTRRKELKVHMKIHRREMPRRYPNRGNRTVVPKHLESFVCKRRVNGDRKAEVLVN